VIERNQWNVKRMVLIVLMTAVIELFQDMDQSRRGVQELEVVLRDQRRDRALDRRVNARTREVDLILVDIVVIEENTQSLDLEVLKLENILVIDVHLWKTSSGEPLVMGVIVVIIQSTEVEVMVIIEIILVLRCLRVADMSAIVKTLRRVDVSGFLV
jgi:hypothetical protein